MASEALLLRRAQLEIPRDEIGVAQPGERRAGAPLDAPRAHVGVHHVGRGVAVEREHLVVREAVVGVAVHREVGVPGAVGSSQVLSEVVLSEVAVVLSSSTDSTD